MQNNSTISNIAVADTGAYLAALAFAERRAMHSFFDQHIVEDETGGYLAVDEGDYNALPMRIIDRIVHTVPGAMSDEW